MKTLFRIWIATCCFVLVWSCGGKSSGDSNDSEKNESEQAQEQPSGYYLHDGKVYLHNFAENRSEIVELAKNPVRGFWLSPKREYIVFTQETYRNDCLMFSSLGIYDLTKKLVVKELGKEQYSKIYFQKWESDKSFSFVEEIAPDDKPGHGQGDLKPFSWTHTIGGGRDATIMSEHDYAVNDYWLTQETEDAPSVNPDVNSIVRDGRIVLENKKTGESKTISVSGDDIISYHLNTWLNADQFLFSVKHAPFAQCDDDIFDLYLYDLKTETAELIKKDASFLQMIEK